MAAVLVRWQGLFVRGRPRMVRKDPVLVRFGRFFARRKDTLARLAVHCLQLCKKTSEHLAALRRHNQS